MSADPIDWIAMRTLPLVLVGLLLTGCLGSHASPDTACEPGEVDCTSFDEVLVQVYFEGAGEGLLVSEGIETIPIDCTTDRDHQQCFTVFDDAGGGGNFRIVATAQTGSVFDGWKPGSCTSESGAVCHLEFAQETADTTFAITARFDRIPVEMNEITLYNGTLGTANLVTDSEGQASGSLGPSSTRTVSVPSAIGSSITIRAFVGGTFAARVTCIVTAAAWQGGSTPLVDLFSDGGYVMHCNGF